MLSNKKREALLDGNIRKGSATWWKSFVTFGYSPAAVLCWRSVLEQDGSDRNSLKI